MTIGSGYNALVGTRASAANPKTTEYFNTKTGQGFSDANSLASFVNSNFAGSNANAANVFSLLGTNYAAPKPAAPLVGPPAPTSMSAPPAPAKPATPSYNPLDLVKPFASLAAPFTALTGGTPTPNLPTPVTPKPLAPTLTPPAMPNMPSGMYYGPQAKNPMANPNDHGTPPATPQIRIGYGDVVNVNGEIQNPTSGKRYSSKEELAADLGVRPENIDWNQIKKSQGSGPPANLNSPEGIAYLKAHPELKSTTTTTGPTKPNVSFPDNVTGPSGVTVNPATGGVVDDGSGAPAGGPPVAPSGYSSPEYLAAMKAYTDSLQLSPEEITNQQNLDNLNSSLAIGESNTNDQVIPMEFITGQKKSMEDRTLALEKPLQAKAALLQAKRTAAQDASKFALDQMDKKIQAEQDSHKPVSVAPGSTLVDPATGKPVYSAPALGTSGGTGDDAIVTSQIHAVSGTDSKGAPFNQAFINLTDFPDAASKSQALAYGAAHGIPVLNPGEGEKMVSIDNAYTNIDKIADGLSGLVANTPGFNLAQGLYQSISGEMGDSGVASFNAWRTAVINNVQALAGGSGSGLRINQAEIDTALKNDLPVIQGLGADTMGSATAKLNRLKDQLDSWRSTLLDKGNAAGGSSSTNDPLGLGFNQGGGGTPTATGMRTDRNNNPTAMTTAVAKSLGLVEGKDYINTNDTFGGGQYATAKLLGDPVQTTIKGFDLAASRTAAQKAQSGGAFSTASGKARWSYGTPTDAQWLAMSPTQKVAAVQKMYQQEGGVAMKSAFNLA